MNLVGPGGAAAPGVVLSRWVSTDGVRRRGFSALCVSAFPASSDSPPTPPAQGADVAPTGADPVLHHQRDNDIYNNRSSSPSSLAVGDRIRQSRLRSAAPATGCAPSPTPTSVQGRGSRLVHRAVLASSRGRLGPGIWLAMAAGVAGARLPLLRVSPATAPRSVAANNDPLCLSMMSCRCAPPTIAGESGNGSVRCGGGWQAP